MILAAAIFAAHGSGALAQDEPGAPFSPYAGKNYPLRVLWGDTHLHTNFSPDANASGNTRVGPDEAYRFARGEELTGHNGLPAKLNRALDFLVVSDHAEYLGLLPLLRSGDPLIRDTAFAREWYPKITSEDPGVRSRTTGELIQSLWAQPDAEGLDSLARKSAWEATVRAADANNVPGVFSAFAGFEWTSMPGGNNLHRVVVFGDGAERLLRILPFGSTDSEDPAELWRYLEGYERDTAGRAIAIPHNSNGSNGMMFAPKDSSGAPIDRSYAELRARWEPIVEITQIKGDSETHPLLSPDDEFADFETWDRSNLLGLAAKTPEMLPYEYARSALKIGLEIERDIGANPFAFGMIGSTDAHTGFATAEEDNFWGAASGLEPGRSRTAGELINSPLRPEWSSLRWEQAASGYAGVWATENTRQAIFDALLRREVYATTGPRITVRFFGGWSFEIGDQDRPHLPLIGYGKGVPMGAVLPGAPDTTAAPRFLVAARRDPEGANLDRLQIVKGWLDADGKLHEKVYDIALSDDRTAFANRRSAAVGSTVDVASATYANTIGAAELSAVWQDPSFDPGEPAFYYLRVIEIPTPRWTAYEKRRFGAEVAGESPMITQERAYTSPIWYRPPGS
jgi:hypothetical protein